MIHDCSNRQAGAIDTHSRWCFNLLHASLQWITQFIGGEGGANPADISPHLRPNGEASD